MQGEKGVFGKPGPQGQKGDIGPSGAKGLMGPSGPAGIEVRGLMFVQKSVNLIVWYPMTQ